MSIQPNMIADTMLHKLPLHIFPLLPFLPLPLLSTKQRCIPSSLFLPPPLLLLLPLLRLPPLLFLPPPLHHISLRSSTYIDRGDYPKKFDYAVWKLNMFLCSDVKLPSTGKFHVKCIECNCKNDLGCTNPFANHAEAKHRDIPHVAEWIA